MWGTDTIDGIICFIIIFGFNSKDKMISLVFHNNLSDSEPSLS